MRTDPSLLPRRGDVVAGKYRIERVLGGGGMACVMAAQHVALGRWFAIKFLVLEGRTARERFEREARANAAIQSPYVARVFEVGSLADGTPFFVMDLLEGHDLQRHLALHGVLLPEDAAGLIVELCRGLEEAHAIGIIHRDLKPQNVFLSDDPGGPRVRILDFGIAKVAFDDRSLTRTHHFLGTAQYMAPEQILEAAHVDARCDVWSLGACLYAMLAGRPPFDDTNVATICRRVLTEEPPPIQGLRPDVPPALAAVVHRCLSKAPDARFGSVAELAAAVLAAVASPPPVRPHAATAPPRDPMERPAARRELFLLTIVTMACILATMAIVWTGTPKRSPVTTEDPWVPVDGPVTPGRASAAPVAPDATAAPPSQTGSARPAAHRHGGRR